VHSWGMPPVMFSVITKYHKGRHSLFLYNSEIFYAFTQDILRSHGFRSSNNNRVFLVDSQLSEKYCLLRNDVSWSRNNYHE
ncbi:hypothetical protein J3324_02780, partial [Leuconostoc mesenteroides]|nr:hypothetical protein [Leuconostoc mesenteroides]